MYNKPSEHHPGITQEAPCRNLRNNRNQAAICTKIFRTSWNHCGNRTRTHTGTYTGNHHARTSRTTTPERLEPPPRNPLRKLPGTRTGTSQPAHPHQKLHRTFISAVTPKPTLLGEITLLYTRWCSVALAFFWWLPHPGLGAKHRVVPMASISSMKTMDGAFSRAKRKTSRTMRGPSPKYFWTNSDPTIPGNGSHDPQKKKGGLLLPKIHKNPSQLSCEWRWPWSCWPRPWPTSSSPCPAVHRAARRSVDRCRSARRAPCGSRAAPRLPGARGPTDRVHSKQVSTKRLKRISNVKIIKIIRSRLNSSDNTYIYITIKT